MIMLLIGDDFIKRLPLWFNDVAMFSLVPLFIKESSVYNAIAAELIFVCVRSLVFKSTQEPSLPTNYFSILRWGSNLLMIIISCAAILFPTPISSLPDLWNVVISAISSFYFGFFLALYLVMQFNCQDEKKKVE